VLYAIYNSGRSRDKAELRASNAATIMLSSVVRAALFRATGLLSQDGLISLALLLVPALLVVSGVSLLARAALG
jgi:hypothetical protein